MYAKRLFRKTALAAALIATFVALGGATMSARADDCYHKIQTREWKLREAIQRHGYNSWEARHDRDELAKARISCNARPW
ncbi:MAG: hypothetical protein WA871_05925 [Candidatus Acidiferrales bacterium]